MRLTKAQMEQSKSRYLYEVPMRDGTIMYVDTEKEDSCYGRYINDPPDDSMVNAKVITKGERLVIIDTTDIHELVTELYCRWGIPEMVVSDRGGEFRNRLMKRINHVFKVNRIATTPYNPRSNVLVENIKDQLYHYVESRQKDWDIFLLTIQLMFNTIVNAATAYTLHYVMLGRECNRPAMGDMLGRMEENNHDTKPV